MSKLLITLLVVMICLSGCGVPVGKDVYDCPMCDKNVGLFTDNSANMYKVWYECWVCNFETKHYNTLEELEAAGILLGINRIESK